MQEHKEHGIDIFTVPEQVTVRKPLIDPLYESRGVESVESQIASIIEPVPEIVRTFVKEKSEIAVSKLTEQLAFEQHARFKRLLALQYPQASPEQLEKLAAEYAKYLWVYKRFGTQRQLIDLRQITRFPVHKIIIPIGYLDTYEVQQTVEMYPVSDDANGVMVRYVDDTSAKPYVENAVSMATILVLGVATQKGVQSYVYLYDYQRK